jgi:hypothetical protein
MEIETHSPCYLGNSFVFKGQVLLRVVVRTLAGLFCPTKHFWRNKLNRISPPELPLHEKMEKE